MPTCVAASGPTTPPARQSWVPCSGSSALAEIKRPDPFWRARFRSPRDCWRATGTSATHRSRSRPSAYWRLVGSTTTSRQRACHHGRRRPLHNRILRRDAPELAAFIDWETCTVGDPSLDLGWILACWPDDPNPIDDGSALASLGGIAPAPSWTTTLRWRISSWQSSSRAPGRATSCRPGQCADGVAVARLGGEPHRVGHLGGPGRQSVRVTYQR